MDNIRGKNAAANVIVGILALAAIAGCSHATDASAAKPTGSADGAARSCMAPPAQPITSKPVIAVLVGITTSDQNPDINRTRTGAVQRVIAAGSELGARLIVSGIGADAADTTAAVNTQLDSPGPNPLARQHSARCKNEGIVAAVTAMTQARRPGPVDVFGAIRSLASHLTGLSGQRVDVVVLSSTLNAISPLNLSDPAVLGAPAAELVSVIVEAGILPDCAGWNVYIVGGGRAATSSLSTTDISRLHAFWSALFARCGGRLVLFDSDLTQYPISPTNLTARAEKTSVTPAAVTGPLAVSTSGDDQILDARPRQRGELTQIVFTLPGALLFQTASATLEPNTDKPLAALRDELTTSYPTEPVTITGYTDADANLAPGGNQALSERRAAAVAAWLSGNGIAPARLSCAGRGPADPIADNTTPAGRAANRRVEIAVTITKAQP